nr:glycosyltransferase [Campylobacterota bacterium]
MHVNQPLVSVVINCYNSDTYLKEAIESVFNQTYQNWEIIFWDNQSTDRSAEIIKSYNDNRIKYFYAPVHTPLGEARNLA